MTETATSPAKEDNISPIEPEKKTDAKQEPEAVKPENEATDSKPEEKKEVRPIDNGYLLKKSKIIGISHWSKSYFAFGSQPVALPNLKTYYRKNVKKGIPKPIGSGSTSNAAETEVKDGEAPKLDDPTKADDSAKVDDSTKADDSTKVDESKKVEEQTSSDVVEVVKESKGDDKPKEDKPVDDKKSPETKDELSPFVRKVYQNIAHASHTGEGLLFYFKSDSETHKNIPHGIINLKDVVDVTSLTEHVGKQFAFKIETTYRTFELAAENEEDRDSWIKTIKERSDRVKETQESPEAIGHIEASEKYKETYEKLIKGTAFIGEVSKHAGELSDEPFSGEDEPADNKSRAVDGNKRKSFLPFAFGRKASTAEPSATTVTEDTEDSSKVVTTPAEVTTDETEENKSGEPKSPLKTSKLFNFFNKKPEPTPKADDEKAKTADETTNAETSTAAAANETTETPADETTQHKEGSSFFKNINNIFNKPKPTGETSETKAEPTEPSADVTTTEAKNDGNKETEETSDHHDAEDKDKTEDKTDKAEDKTEHSLVRRVTTKIFGAKRAKSPKADEKKQESLTRELGDKIDETEENREETSETKPTENTDATAQTSEQNAEQTVEQNAEQTAGPESSTETENKKKEKSSIFSFARRKSGGVSKKENSESHEKTETDPEAVTSPTEATDVEEPKEAEKVEKSGQRAVFPDEKKIKKKGNLQKLTGYIKKSFEQRYFVLTDDKKLTYYRSNTDASTQKSIEIVKVKIVDEKKFDLETRIRSYKLSADSKEERDSWIQVFKELEFEVDESHESTSEDKEATKKDDVVPPSGSGNENVVERSGENAADKPADTTDAKVSEAQETTTQTAKVEETKGETEEITTVTTETITESVVTSA
ncbi:hypothetical protein RclHR1_03550002 [Rhizophagus clarus]|uniref:Immunogenic protein n=1 Tax=Rhizophagus clarus TaxID=94130 RepID=A0A2Z6REW2_9GLOM|nr:hypothetical protein RclHR1_03550002 [Rhizophagus clarus]GES77495.1 immunogenic protein [Rhizophagus clarus]